MKYIDQYGDEMELTFMKSTYVDSGRPYIVALCDEGYGPEEYADVTVNLSAPLTDNDGYHVHVDTNDCKYLIGWMVDLGLLAYTGSMAQSGWFAYPEVELNHEWYDELESLGW